MPDKCAVRKNKTPCAPTKICNPTSGRCVLKTGAIGKALLGGSSKPKNTKKVNGNWKAEIAKLHDNEYKGHRSFEMHPSVGFVKQLNARIKQAGVNMNVSVPEVRSGDVLKVGFNKDEFFPIKTATVGGLLNALLDALRQAETVGCSAYGICDGFSFMGLSRAKRGNVWLLEFDWA